MKLRTEDALGYFSTQMLGNLALPSVTREAVRRGERFRTSAYWTEAEEQMGRRAGMSSETFRGVDSGRYASTLAETKPTESLVARARRLVSHTGGKPA